MCGERLCRTFKPRLHYCAHHSSCNYSSNYCSYGTTDHTTSDLSTNESTNRVICRVVRKARTSQVPSAAPTSNDDDFFSILNRTYGKVESTTPVNVETTASVNAPSLYTAGYVLDDFGKQRITEIGRSVGICSTCGGSGTIRNGLRAEVRGIVSEVSTTNGPHKLAVSSVQVSNNLTSICQAPSGSTAATSPSQSPNLRPSRTSGLFERVRSVFDSLFAFLA